jgi:alpha-L-rhamnosidase
LGVRPLAPQYAQFQIKPLWFGEKLGRASGKVPTERGDIEVTWEKRDGRFSLTTTIPPNMRAAVYQPKNENNYVFLGEVGSGSHHFTGEAA